MALAVRIWFWYLAVQVGLRRWHLPELVRRLGRVRRVKTASVDPHRLGRAIVRVLEFGPFRPRCLHYSLVHFRLLREEAIGAQLVIGLAAESEDHRAHAWVEVDRISVGPPPGRSGYVELARYGGDLEPAGGRPTP